MTDSVTSVDLGDQTTSFSPLGAGIEVCSPVHPNASTLNLDIEVSSGLNTPDSPEGYCWDVQTK